MTGRAVSLLPPHGAVPSTRSGRSEVLLFLAAYLIYVLARWLTVADFPTADRNAQAIIDLERQLGVAVERPVQEGLDGTPLMWALSNVYLAAQLVVLPGALVWLHRRAPRIYRPLRDTVIATWMLAIPIYALFPVAPPRLAGAGLVDTVGAQAGVALTGRSTMFFNPLAAVPSLHCGFAAAVGLAAALAVRGRAARVAWLAWPPLVCLTVVATGNHYLFDIAAGLAVSLGGYVTGRWFRRRSRGAARRLGGPVIASAPA